MIEFKNITKKFGSFLANDGITLSIKKNTVHCILGENGAGKSTLVKILFGIYKPDEGTLNINGHEVKFNSPNDAIKNGIGMVHQHFMLIDDFTVLENVILGNEISSGLKIDFQRSKDVIQNLIKKYDLNLPLEKKIYELGIGEQQKVEILKLLYRNSEILIFDEPTSVLSPAEINEFFQIIDEFKQNGKTIILITHKLAEVTRSADAVSVLRKGKLVYNETKPENQNYDLDKISNSIVGELKISKKSERINRKPELPVMKFKNVTFIKDGIKKLDALNLEIHKGEIHGLCGVEGNGQTEIVELLSGIEKEYSGELKIDAEKISLVPDDRNRKGFIKEFSIGENILLKNSSEILISNEKILEESKSAIENYNINVSSISVPLSSLSGGNQQKMILAREIEYDGDLMIFFHPTRGVDLNAAYFIHSLIIEQRNLGKSILLISSDLDELISLSDRLSVIYKGKILRSFNRDEFKTTVPESELLEKNDDENIFKEIGKLMIGIDNGNNQDL